MCVRKPAIWGDFLKFRACSRVGAIALPDNGDTGAIPFNTW
jgi:hypothetical protein